MQNNNQNTNKVLIVIVIVLVLIIISMFCRGGFMGGGYGMMWNRWGAKPVVNQYTQTNQNPNGADYQPQQHSDGTAIWIMTTTPGFIISYNSAWDVKPAYYGSAAMQAEGKSEMVGYIFSMGNDALIVWGGHQSDCLANEIGTFTYGVSTNACVKNMHAYLQSDGMRAPFSMEEKNAFGDFVLKNK